MKKLNLTFFALSFLFASYAHAYKFVIFTDEANPKKAAEIAELFKTNHPFSTFKIEVEIVNVPATDLECGSTNGIDRLVTCKDVDDFQKKAMKRGGDQAMVVKDLAKWGGAAAEGGVPVITTGTSARAMLHEYLHVLGLCDEYEYSMAEASTYCGNEKSAPNTAFINPLPEGYSDDAFARKSHAGDIPWYGEIKPGTLITNGNKLGTGMINFSIKAPVNITDITSILDDPTGLYQGKVCDLAATRKFSWLPGSRATIMENTEAGLGAPLEKIVDRIMVSKGARKKLQIDEPKIVERSGDISVPGPEVVVDNTPRNFFKSFFQWLEELFKSIGNSFGR